MKRAIAKNPSIVDSSLVVKFDTTIITESVEYRDTFVTKSIDTIVITNGKSTTKIIRHHDTIQVDQIIRGDTIVINKEIRVPQVIYTEAKKPNYLLYLVILLIGLFGVYRLIK
jgi:hypothetical protein